MSDAKTIAAETPPASPSSVTVPAAHGGRRREEIEKILFVVPAALAIIALFGYPVVKNLIMSFQDYGLKTFFTGEAPWIGLQNYVTVVTDEVFTKAVVNTALFTLGSIAGQFVIGMLLALFFHKNFPLNGVLRALFLLPWLIPLIVGSAAWRAILEQDSGILNVTLRHVGIIHSAIPWLTSPDVALIAVILVNIWLGIPFNMTLLYSGLQHIPDDLYEAGAMDGATGWKAFWHITLPNMRAVVGVVLMLLALLAEFLPRSSFSSHVGGWSSSPHIGFTRDRVLNHHWIPAPITTLWILGSVFALLALAYWLCEVRGWRPQWLVVLGQTALMLYFVHQVIVYTVLGDSWLANRVFGPHLNFHRWWQFWAANLALIAACVAMGYAWQAIKVRTTRR
jgi:multiple sugar transport system permease protein